MAPQIPIARQGNKHLPTGPVHVWISCLDSGNHVWISRLDFMFGFHVWISCLDFHVWILEPMFGSHVWILETMFGFHVWISCPNAEIPCLDFHVWILAVNAGLWRSPTLLKVTAVTGGHLVATCRKKDSRQSRRIPDPAARFESRQWPLFALEALQPPSPKQNLPGPEGAGP